MRIQLTLALDVLRDRAPQAQEGPQAHDETALFSDTQKSFGRPPIGFQPMPIEPDDRGGGGVA